MRLANFILTAVKNHNTSLGENGAFPKREDVPFEYHILKSRYNEILQEINKELGHIPTIDEASTLLSKAVTEAKKIEAPIKEQLEKLAECVTQQILSVPPQTILFDASLVDEVVPTNSLRIMPENGENDENAYTFQDVDEIQMANQAILKRRFINSLVQGASYTLMRRYVDCEALDDWADNLFEIYQRIIRLNDFLLFNKEERISDKHPMLGAYVETHLGKGNEKTIIDAQGLIYPLLLQESFRGYFELFASKGLPLDVKKANYIMHNADIMVAEAWDLRMGIALWKHMEHCFGEIEPSVLPYLFTAIVKHPIHEFNELMQNILCNTIKAKEYVNGIVEQVIHDREYNLFKQDIQNINLQKTVITDDTVLDGIVGEMKVFHGSRSDFEAFSTDFIGNGEGTQSFGWGVYVTQDEKTGNFYCNASQRSDYLTIDGKPIKDYSLEELQTMGKEFVILRHMYDRTMEKNLNSITALCHDFIEDRDSQEYENARALLIAFTNPHFYNRLIQGNKFLYELEIPDDNGSNYLYWEKVYDGDEVREIASRINEGSRFSNGVFLLTEHNFEPLTGEKIYTRLKDKGVFDDNFERDKSASLLLSRSGFVGVSVPIGFVHNNYEGNGRNYVIFNANDIKIIAKRSINESIVRKNINEGYNAPNFDIEHVNRIDWNAEFDEDDLNDELDGCETEEDRNDAINDYYTSYMTIETECSDIDGNSLGWFDGTYDEIEEYFGEEVANEILSNVRDKQIYKGYIDDILYRGADSLDYNDADAVNAYAEKMFPNEEGFSKYILPNGKTIGLTDHIYISSLGSSNVDMTKAKFMSYGSIRLGGSDYGSIGIIKEPTNAQYSVIKDYVRQYANSGNAFEVHFCSYDEGDREPHPLFTATYTYPDPERVKWDIIHYYRDGIKPVDALI